MLIAKSTKILQNFFQFHRQTIKAKKLGDAFGKV